VKISHKFKKSIGFASASGLRCGFVGEFAASDVCACLLAGDLPSFFVPALRKAFFI
jgi:hypothetical protein